MGTVPLLPYPCLAAYRHTWDALENLNGIDCDKLPYTRVDGCNHEWMEKENAISVASRDLIDNTCPPIPLIESLPKLPLIKGKDLIDILEPIKATCWQAGDLGCVNLVKKIIAETQEQIETSKVERAEAQLGKVTELAKEAVNLVETASHKPCSKEQYKIAHAGIENLQNISNMCYELPYGQFKTKCWNIKSATEDEIRMSVVDIHLNCEPISLANALSKELEGIALQGALEDIYGVCQWLGEWGCVDKINARLLKIDEAKFQPPEPSPLWSTQLAKAPPTAARVVTTCAIPGCQLHHPDSGRPMPSPKIVTTPLWFDAKTGGWVEAKAPPPTKIVTPVEKCQYTKGYKGMKK